MTDIDDRLARDIAAVTGGVVVTDSDLREARSAVHQAVESSRKRDRRRHAAVAAAAAVAVVAAGAAVFATLGGDEEETARFAGPDDDLHAGYLIGSAPTDQLVAGMWRVDNGETVLTFDENGTVRFDDRGTLFSAPVTTGTYAISGDVITVTITADDDTRCIGTTAALRAAIPEAGAMLYVGPVTTGTCSPLPPGQGALEQVLPTAQSLMGYEFAGEVGWAPPSDASLLHGVWLAEGGGHVLEMDPDGTYHVAGGSAELVDRGQWSLRDGGLTLTSVGSTSCGEGAQLVLGSVELVSTGTRAFRGTVTDNACGGAWTPITWFLLPNAAN